MKVPIRFWLRAAALSLVIGGVLLGAMPVIAQTTTHTIDLSTSQANTNNWNVYEISGGQLISSKSVFLETYAGIPIITFPFSYNDGFWYATTAFSLPVNASAPVLRITSGAVDDRAVFELNGNIVANTGGDAPGNGYMVLTDGGSNESMKFLYPDDGTWNVKIDTGFKPGINTFKIIVNNTDQGIFGAPCSLSCGGPTNVGVLATVTYQAPAVPTHAGLVADGTGALYGVTASGGVAKDGCCGTVFKLTPPGTGQTAWTKTTLYAFTGQADGKTPEAGLMIGGDGGLYGTTDGGGVQGQFGVVYELTPPTGSATAWTDTVLYSFAGGADGDVPDGGLTLGLDGVTLYGVTSRGGTGACKSPSGDITGCGTVYSLIPPAGGQTAWTKTVLYNFQGRDGQYPTSGLWIDENGALYGTTTYGGSGSCRYTGGTKAVGCGVVFKLTPPAAGQTAWTESTLYSFTGNKFGSYPRTALVGDSAGNLYGTSETTTGQGSGIVFELRPPYGSKTTWTMYLRGQVPHYGAPFGSTPAVGDLAIGTDGTLYGTASTGGDLTGCGGVGCGTAFSLQPPPKGSSSLAPWTLTTLYDFAGGDSASGDGALPHWGLMLGSGGVVSGVTGAGGTGTCGTAVGCGTVFELTPPAAGSTGWTETVQYRFQGWQDGYAP